MTNEHGSSNEFHLPPPSLSSKKKRETVSIDDLNLPRSVVLRLVKKVLPEHTSIQKDAITALIRGSSVFINYLSAAAFDLSKLSSRKVILPSDVLKAIENIEFSSFIPRMTGELELYEEILKEKKNGIELNKDSSIIVETKDEHIIKKVKMDDSKIFKKTIKSYENEDNEYDNHSIDSDDYSKVDEIDRIN